MARAEIDPGRELAGPAVDGPERLPQSDDSTYVLGLPSSGNLLLNADSIGTDAWRAWQSTLGYVEDGILVSSNESAYSAFLNIDSAGLNLEPGQTYVALVWVQGSTDLTDGHVQIIVREEGVREGESVKSFRLSNSWKPILVEHTITKPNLASLEVHLLRVNPGDGDDAFVFREAQLRQIVAE